jgi:flagellar motility protein MotE (MotC chaperone)
MAFDTTISRTEARKRGLKHFATGKPCVRGHLAKRFVSYGGCFDCARETNAQWRKDNTKKKSEADRAYREAKPEEKRARDAAYYAANSERIKARVKKYEKENRELVNLASRKWYAANKNKSTAAQRRYRKANPDKIAARCEKTFRYLSADTRAKSGNK